jgi:hypothetical protein
MLLQDFSGGLNTRVAPSLLQPNQAQVYQNIDHQSGSLRPIKGHTIDTNGVDKYFTWYNYKNEYVSSTTEASFVEFKDTMYYTQLNSYPVSYDGTNTYRLGIVAPSTIVSPARNTAGNLSGTYTYVYTYYNSVTGIESQPCPISSNVSPSSESVLVQLFVASTDPQVDTIRVYRNGGALTDYTLVGTKANDTSNYVDNIADIDVAGNHILDSWEYQEAPMYLKYIYESYAMLFGAVGDKLWYSNTGQPAYWPAVNFIDFPDNITGIASIQGGLIIFTRYKSYLITGNTPDTFSKQLLDGEQGCISHYSIKYTNNNLLWLSEDGICTTTGGMITVISLPILGIMNLQGFNNCEVYERGYYMSYADGILVFDFRYNTMVKFIDIKVDWLHRHDGVLYASILGDAYSMFSGSDMTYKYKSPILTDGSYSMRKDYKDFYIKYNGPIILKIYVDGELKNEKELTGNSCYNLKALASSSGYGLEIEIEGTGEVSEIEYKALGRQNGR